MSGVIDRDGTQWEHCNVCGGFVKIQNLLYEKPSKEFDCGRDVCSNCWKKLYPEKVPNKGIPVRIQL
jgi:hypothetical protein